jgi:DNA polymerase III alpha subunit (gram-positive type)
MAYNNHFVCFDLETGGLKKSGDCSPITEIAICVVDNSLKDFEEYTTLIKPYVSEEQYSPEALKVSNITLSMCGGSGIDPKQAAKEIMDVFKRAKSKDGGKKPILVGHNIDDFDIPILSYFLKKFGYDLEKVVETKQTIDTKWWGRLGYPNLPGFTLGDCLGAEGVDILQAHRALHDTRANKELFIGMLRRLRGEGASLLEKKPPFRETFRFQIESRS